jgi:pimeloyl-ACP methyl ester carboxylesterase
LFAKIEGRAPTLILVGPLDVADIVQIADRLERDIRGARKVVLPEIGHPVNLEAPDRFRALVTEFLAGC